MKRTQLTVLISFFLIFFISITTSAKKIDLKLRLLKGEHYTYVINQENTVKEATDEVTINQTLTLKIDHKVINHLPNGNYLIESSLKSFRIIIKYNGKVIRYNSDTVDVANNLYKTLNFLTDIKLNYELSPQGIVTKLSGFEPIKKKSETDARLSGMLRSFGNEQFILEQYNYIPITDVGVGDKWKSSGILPDLKNLKYDILNTLKEVSEKNLKLNQEATFMYSTETPMAEGKVGKMNETGTIKGILVIDPKTRMPLSSDIEQQITVSAPDQTNPNGEKIRPFNIVIRTTMALMKK